MKTLLFVVAAVLLVCCAMQSLAQADKPEIEERTTTEEPEYVLPKQNYDKYLTNLTQDYKEKFYKYFQIRLKTSTKLKLKPNRIIKIDVEPDSEEFEDQENETNTQESLENSGL